MNDKLLDDEFAEDLWFKALHTRKYCGDTSDVIVALLEDRRARMVREDQLRVDMQPKIEDLQAEIKQLQARLGAQEKQLMKSTHIRLKQKAAIERLCEQRDSLYETHYDVKYSERFSE